MTSSTTSQSPSPAPQRRDPSALLTEAVELRGKRVLDIGCGEGALSRFLADFAAEVVGVECNTEMLVLAQQGAEVANLRFVQGVGEALPFADESVDVIVYSNSLHHVPVASQGAALREAARVLRRGGDLLVLEPIARGPFQEMLAPIHDETEVRARAQEELEAAVRSGGFEAVARDELVNEVTLPSFDAFRERVLRINPDRREAIAAGADAWRARFESAGIRCEGGWRFEQPLQFTHLRRTPVSKALRRASVTALVEMSESDGALSGKVLGRALPPLVGLSLYIEATTAEGAPYRLLYDTSSSWKNLRRNAAAAGVDLRALDAIFISHWHFDHSAALPQLLRWIGRSIPIYAPPLSQPYDPLKGAISLRLPEGADVRFCPAPTTLVDGIQTTGSKQTAFPRRPLVVDEHALSLRVDDRGVTVLVGCSHAPLEWLIDQAAGEEELGWLIGGLHFTVPTTAARKQELLAYLTRRGPRRISPMHCTTKQGIAEVERALPGQFQAFTLGDRLEV
ncbi:MAG: methyltransferase domain-containing protein [Myxococcales bacterium]|nr:methyltransferase domain-containing protein [Myxococcales bacterium]MCB9751031.1 methyltransferase domain-containing protein [Myxococcales bacterium]